MNNIQSALEAQAKRLYDYDRNKRDAKIIERWADEYCRCLDELKINPNDRDLIGSRDSYIAALMLKFWDSVGKLYSKTISVGCYEYEDFISILYDRINYACKYRAWQKPDSKVNAQACINQAIATEVKNIFYRANLDKSKANSACNKVSMDTPIAGDDKMTIGDSLGEYDPQMESDAQYLIQSLLNSNSVTEAMIADVVAHGDCENEKKESYSYTDEDGKVKRSIKIHSEFSRKKTARALNELSDEYVAYFVSKYAVKKEIAEACFKKIRNSDNQKLYKYIKSFQDKLGAIVAN